MSERLQITWTPWRNHGELLSVRECFFPASASSGEQKDPKSRRKACDQVSTWKLRGKLPHGVEATWLLTEAILIDQKPVVEQMPMFAITASYITAISRFVTGLLDSQQESKYKVSMYTQAQRIGLPALFVDIRHEATHGDMPNLTNLRSAADRALGWLWDDYWKGLEGETSSTRGAKLVVLGESERVMEAWGGDEEEQEQEQPGGWQKWQGRWTPTPIGTII